jgi:hypothetical protein
MRIFLSYASEDRETAETIYLALRDQGHRVFYDRAELPAGDEYHNRIRAAIQRAHLFLLLISPQALDAGSYTLTECDIAAKARRRLLPVMLREIDIARLPVSFRAVTIHQPDGNLAASVAAEVHRISDDLAGRRWKQLGAAGGILAMIAAGVFYGLAARKGREYTGRDGAPAVLIPAGRFVIGDDKNTPRREVFLDAFYMDKYEVTVARYAKFLEATGNVKLPEEWDTADPQIGAELPVVGVDWHDADSYCRWAASGCRATLNGKGRRAVLTNASIPGVTRRRRTSTRDSASPTTVRSTRVGLPRSGDTRKGRAHLASTISRATPGSGWRTGTPRPFPAPERETRAGPTRERRK